MVYKLSWGLALVFGGLTFTGVAIPYLAFLTGICLIIAGVAFIAGM